MIQASFDLQPWQWFLALLGAFLVGFSKTGIAGIGALTVAIYANILPARQSTGVILPMLVCADIVAVAAYRRHAVWSHLWRLFPWVVIGIVGGFFAMDYINDAFIQKSIGCILIVMVALQLLRKKFMERENNEANEAIPHGLWFAATTGILGGFATMLANAAGPIMILYMLAMRLKKMEFLGTGAWYFLILNIFKLPFSYKLGLITPQSADFDLMMAPLVISGAFLGRFIVRWINQKLFEVLALVFTFIAGLRLIF